MNQKKKISVKIQKPFLLILSQTRIELFISGFYCSCLL